MNICSLNRSVGEWCLVSNTTGDWHCKISASLGEPSSLHFYANFMHESSEAFDSLLLSHIHCIMNSIDWFVLSVGLSFAFFLDSLLFLLFLYSGW